LVSVDGGLKVKPVERMPSEPTVEAQPIAIGLAREEGPITIDPQHPQLVIVLGVDAGRIQPGKRPARSTASERSLGHQPHPGASARQVVRAGDADCATTDDCDPELCLIAHAADKYRGIAATAGLRHRSCNRPTRLDDLLAPSRPARQPPQFRSPPARRTPG
jgi:hypothetical protein